MRGPAAKVPCMVRSFGSGNAIMSWGQNQTKSNEQQGPHNAIRIRIFFSPALNHQTARPCGGNWLFVPSEPHHSLASFIHNHYFPIYPVMPAELNGGGEVTPAGSAALSPRAQEVEQVRPSAALQIVVSRCIWPYRAAFRGHRGVVFGPRVLVLMG
jgi:hypothetical protein